MNKILFATDFSEGASYALPYAIQLSRSLNCPLLLYHCCFVPVYASDVPYEVIPTEEYLTAAKEKLNKLVESLHDTYKDLQVETVLQQGVASEGILKYANENKIEWIVLGAKGMSLLKQIFVGSTADAVLLHAKNKVLMIPEKTAFRNFDKIIYATDYHEKDLSYLKETCELARMYNSRVKVLHVSDLERTESFEKNMFNWFEEEVLKTVKYDQLSFELKYSPAVAYEIVKTINADQADLLVMITRKRGLLSRMFDKSLTKEVAHHLHVPMLCFHTTG